MRNKPLRFGRNEEDEGIKQKKKYEETLKQKKEQLKQEFDHLEEIRKYDELSVNSLNEVKFKNELDKLFNMRKQKNATLESLNKQLSDIKQKNKKSQEGLQSTFTMNSSTGFRSMVNNHHSDQLYQTFSKNISSKQPQELKDYQVELEEEDKRYKQLIENEQQRSESLKLQLETIHKSKIQIQSEIQELQLLNKVATSRFSNIEALHFLADKNDKLSKKNLRNIKTELKEMDQMRKQYKKAQQDKQKEYRKEIMMGEEYVSHNGMKLEEAEQKNAELEAVIQQLEQKEKEIIEKKLQSLNILLYIECFEIFEQVFMNKKDQVESHRLVDKYEVNEELLKEQELLLEEFVQHYKQDSKASFHSDTIPQIPVNFDRNQLINAINNFFASHPQGCKSIVAFMLEKFWSLSEQLQQNNQTYETLLRDKIKFQHQLETLEDDLIQLIDKNSYLKQEEEQDTVPVKLPPKSAEEIKQMQSLVDPSSEVAYDAGLFVSRLSKNSNEQNTPHTLTLNIFRLEFDELADMEALVEKTTKSQNLLFNFLLSLSELLYRAAQIIILICDNSQNMTSVDLDEPVQKITQFIEGLWQKVPEKKNEKKRGQGKLGFSFTSSNIGQLVQSQPGMSQQSSSEVQSSNLLQVNKGFNLYGSNLGFSPQATNDEQGSQDQGQMAVEARLNEYTITTIFKEVLLNNESGRKTSLNLKKYQPVNIDELEQAVAEASHYFFVQSKKDQLMWFLLTPAILRSFLEQIKNENREFFSGKVKNLKMNTNLLLPTYQFSNLRHVLVEKFSKNFITMLDYYKELAMKLKSLSSELKILIKEKDPKFDLNKLDFIPVRESYTIKQARETISRKLDMYRTGEVKTKAKVTDSSGGSTLAKIFLNKSQEDNSQALLTKGLAKIVQPELNAQKERFLLEDDDKLKDPSKLQLNEEKLTQIKTYFRSKLQHKYEPSVTNLKKNNEDDKKKVVKHHAPDKDDFDEERDQIKQVILTEWLKIQEQNNLKNQPSQNIEHKNEKHTLIKEVTGRLYGDRGETAQTLKSMSMTTGILSDIDRLEKQPSAVEQPFLISNYKLQKKAMHRNLNKELSLPTLNFLKPTSAYFQRRQLSQEQLRNMAQKKYDLIESGMAPNLTRPSTESQNHGPKRTATVGKTVDFDLDKYYARYGNEENTQQFLGYLMKKQQTEIRQFDSITLQDFAFPFAKKSELYKTSGNGQRPKSILVYPQS